MYGQKHYTDYRKLTTENLVMKYT
ncbi:MAG: hypothetical protein RL711_989, partial [Bacteroidota bacterium]